MSENTTSVEKTTSVKKNSVFSRVDTKAVKGIAILLMLFHHLAGFPDRFPTGFSGFETWIPKFGEYLTYIAMAGKLCVSMFFFLGGYGIYKRFSTGSFSVKNTILNLYKTYWKVFVVFVPIALLFFARIGEGINELATMYAYTSNKAMISNIIGDFVGWSATFNREWWFFSSYICAIPLGYLFCLAIKKNNNFWVDLFISFGVVVMIVTVFPAIARTEAFGKLYGNYIYRRFLVPADGAVGALFVGIVMAKYDGISKIKDVVRGVPFSTAIACVGVCVVLWFRSFIAAGTMDIVFCIFLTAMSSVVFDKIKPLKKVFAILGDHSTNMWLIHGFFLYYFLEVTEIVYITNNVWVDLLILVEMCLAASILLNGFYAAIGKLGKMINKKLSTKQS